MIERFAQGFGFLLRGWRMLRSAKGLWPLVWIPLAINLVFFFVGLSWGLSTLPLLVAQALGFIFSSPEGWLYSLLYYPLVIIFSIVFIITLSAVVYLLASVVAAPFNGLLAEKVLVTKGLLPEQKFNLLNFLVSSVRMLLVSLVRALILVLVSALLFLLSFFPGLNFVSAYFTLVLLAFDASDYAMETMQMGLNDRIAFLRKNIAEYFGMAACLSVFFLIPGAIVLLMPVIVIGATEQFAQRRVLGSRSNP